ncbi:MAG: hypothetical protein WCG27_01160, partial [Pseudomonadota bacterium]
NNARLSVLLTYQNHQEEIARLQMAKQMNLKDFGNYLFKEYKSFLKEKVKSSFGDYFLKLP